MAQVAAAAGTETTSAVDACKGIAAIRPCSKQRFRFEKRCSAACSDHLCDGS